jgi:hypothetical protein
MSICALRQQSAGANPTTFDFTATTPALLLVRAFYIRED